ncbi:MAG: hypothetical protein HZC02_04810 [Candidatus Levybacteria bacterium]|nr:hypothetical protein [Candidatus Levybacteria bacterium]
MPEAQITNQPQSSSLRIHKKKAIFGVFGLVIAVVLLVIIFLNLNSIKTFFSWNTKAVSEVPGYSFTITNKKTLNDYLLRYNFFNKDVVAYDKKTPVRASQVVFKLVSQQQPYNKLFGEKKALVSATGESYDEKTKTLSIMLYINPEFLQSLKEENLSYTASSELIFFITQISYHNPTADIKEITQLRTQINQNLFNQKVPVFQVKKQ